MKGKELANLIEFTRRIIEAVGFDFQRLDGGEIQDIAEQLGLIVKTKYDPAIHGPSDCCEPGDDWYVFVPFLENTK
jgi:hypothetical protein